MDKYNKSKCKDITAYQAIKNVNLEEKEEKSKVKKAIALIKSMLSIVGFELEGIQGRATKCTNLVN